MPIGTSKRPFLLAATLYGVPAIGLGVLFAVADAHRLLPWLHDDSFYYFEVAKNLALHGNLSFDSIAPTNGFQPLWQLLITPFFLVLRSDFGPIRAVLVFDALLLWGAMFVGFMLIRRWTGNLTIAMIGPLILLYPWFLSLQFSGLEFCAALFAILFFWLLADGWREHGYRGVWRGMVVGVAAALVVLARLDLAPLIFVYFIVVAWAIRRRLFAMADIGAAVSAFAVLALILGAYFASNYVWFQGHLFPVSGAVKSDFSTIHLTDFEMWTGRLRFSWSGILPELGISLFLIPLAGGIGLTACALWRPLAPLNVAMTVTSIGYCLQLLIWQLFLRWRDPAEWWFVMAPVLAVFVLAELLRQLSFRRWMGMARLMNHTSSAMVIVAGVGLLAVAWAWVWSGLEYNSKRSIQLMKMEAAPILEALPDGALAIGDGAGAFGYFADRPVVHLEGLVNDYEYLEYLADGHIEQYLETKEIRYLAVFAFESTPAVWKGGGTKSSTGLSLLRALGQGPGRQSK